MGENNLKSVLKKAFSFKGKINKREYALSLLKLIGFAIIALKLCSVVTVLMVLCQRSPEIDNLFLAIYFILIILSLILPIICIVMLSLYFFAQGVRRCHDIGLSGWHILIPFFFIVLLFTEGTSLETPPDVSNPTLKQEEAPTNGPEVQTLEEPYEWPIDNTGIFTNVFTLMGRIRRSEFLLVVLIGFAILLILPFLFIIWGFALLAESIKRLHDIGLSGYWCIPALVADIFAIFAGIVSPWLLICCVIIFWGYVILLMLVPGTRGINEYGTNPKRSYREQTLEAGYPDI